MKYKTLFYRFDGNLFEYDITLADYNYAYDRALADGLTDEDEIEKFVTDWYEDDAYREYENQIDKCKEEFKYPPYTGDIHGGV